LAGANPNFPPQRYTGRYHVGFETDRERIEPNPQVWEFLFRGVENFILCNPYLMSYEISESGGARFLFSEEVGFLDCPPLVVYFKPDEKTRRVVFLTVEIALDAFYA
jgi:hypothetical protein